MLTKQVQLSEGFKKSEKLPIFGLATKLR